MSLDGFKACKYVRWVDDEWEVWGKDTIQDLGMEGNKLERRIDEIKVERWQQDWTMRSKCT